MNKIRVLLSGVSSNIGGVETFLLEYIRHMDLNKIQFDLICNTEKPACEEEFTSLGVNIYKVSARGRNFVKFRKETEAFFRENAYKYDVFWCNKCMLNNIDFLKYAKKYGIPVRIIHSHNSALMDRGLKGFLMKQLHLVGKQNVSRYATDFWACSDFAGKWFYSQKLMDNNNYCFIPNAVNAEKFRFSDTVRQEYRISQNAENKFVIGHVGRFHLQKNHMFLLDIFFEILKKRPDSELWLIGQGELMTAVQQKVAQLGISEQVRFFGIRKDVPSLMQAMDCFLLPSLFEGLPVVAVEAQAAGLPCYLAGNGTTKLAKLTDRCHYLQLEDSPQVWADAIIQGDVDRVDTYEQIVEAGFELQTAALQLQEKLTQLVKNNG